MFGDTHTYTYSYTGISIYKNVLFGENTMLMRYTNYYEPRPAASA